jgi:predicted AAA+ superfamily ATPase
VLARDGCSHAEIGTVRRPASVTALMTAQSIYGLEEAKADREYWGHLVESAVGAHLANAAATGECEVLYWRERNVEVDFVTRHGHALTALEVKSGRASSARSGPVSGIAGTVSVP